MPSHCTGSLECIHEQGRAEESRWVRRRLLWPEGTRRERGELGLHVGGQELVPVVPLLRPGEGSRGQELEDAGHRKSELNPSEGQVS
jgi:hypothetical protein